LTEKRQLGDLIGGAIGSLMASQKAVKIEMDFKPTMTRDGIIRKRLWYGPYKIKALNVRYSENLSSYADRSN
jgi:hypothetical protein